MGNYVQYHLSLLVIFLTGVFGLEPSFDVPVINVTVQESDVAILPCSVDYLGDHKVVWTDQWSTLLTLDDRRIIDDPRISIERPYTRDWNLHIRKVTYNDRGQYTCQINTNPVKTKTVMLNVLVPSKIVDSLSSRDQTVREGDTVTLVCNVTGVPTPEVTWYKLPNEGLHSSKERLDLEPGLFTNIDSCAYTLQQTGIGTAGEVLIIHNVSRYCDGTYECVAYNNVDPAVTRKIKVFVEFPPEVNLPTKRIGQYAGRETILDCEITAYPHGVMNWIKDGQDIDLMNKDKYTVELYSGNEESTKKTLSLRIRNIQPDDFGEYICFALNTIGQDRETMLLYDYSIHDTKKTTTPQTRLIEQIPKKTSKTPDDTEIRRQGNDDWTDGNGFLTSVTRGPNIPGGGSRHPNRPYQPGEETLPLGSRVKGGCGRCFASATSVLYAISLITSLLFSYSR
ncbi:limbic system-associated membrane protein-like isoform X2 [Mya arenaria]|uniref:limbic system-associated membrane protein-like isoform X2 n=1 Tax=Mya arenaria TaxID=6604 RepID=UPI0022E0D7AE|nr:limbic system-associated membrane protein-like isoform X2 [Mya arenaria]